MERGKVKNLSPAKDIAYVAVMCALLIGGQYVFSFVAGVEIVTLLFVCFSCAFGVRRGVLCAVAFSLLRCFIFGFYPSVVVLYLVYYPLLAAIFGGLGHIGEDRFEKPPLWLAVAVNVLLLGVAAACVFSAALDLIKVSRVYKVTVSVLLWVISGLSVALCIAFDSLFFLDGNGKGRALKTIAFAAVAAVCTITFTLLDDVITPLFMGFSRVQALAYFYASFTAMLPQTVCTVVTVGAFFLPLAKVFNRVVS